MSSPTFVPSFEDLYRIIRAICECEDRKYPNGKGRKMVEEFLAHCVYSPDFEFLRSQFQIPDRGFPSSQKLDITVEPMYGKEWVVVRLLKYDRAA